MSLLEFARLLGPDLPGRLVEILHAVSMEAWLGTGAMTVALLALLGTLGVARRTSRERARIEHMRRDLQAFTEASVRVADSLDHVLRGATPAPEAPASSRRYLLMQARERLQQGESLEALAATLHLCDDEKHLLRFLQAEIGIRPAAQVA